MPGERREKMNGNHEPEKEKLKKKCPLLNDWCIGDACAFSTTLHRNTGGMRQETPMCSIHAALAILSEINQKTQLSQQKMPKIELPGLGGKEL